MKTLNDPVRPPTSIRSHVQPAWLRAAVWLWLLYTALGCRPDLPWPSDLAGTAGGSKRGMELELEPPAPLDAAPRVLRLWITLDAVADASAADVVLVSGEVSDAHLRQLARDDVSKALSERVVPVVAWMDPEPHATDSVRIILAPTIALAEGETYAVASGKAFAAIHFHGEDAARRRFHQIARDGVAPRAEKFRDIHRTETQVASRRAKVRNPPTVYPIVNGFQVDLT